MMRSYVCLMLLFVNLGITIRDVEPIFPVGVAFFSQGVCG